jgi:glutamate carboxypeptidase
VNAEGGVDAKPLEPALHLSVRPEAPVRVILTGHYDTVYPQSPPFRSVVRRADGALNGPGIADMKGGLSIMLGALEAFERHPLATRIGYEVLLSPDEEIGSPGSAALLADIAARGHVGLTYEPCLPDGSLVAARKGSGNFHVTLHGRSAHAGRAFAEGRNALAGAAALAARLHDLNGRREGVTVNIARLDGGGPLNVVPDRAVLRFNARVADVEAAEWVRTALAEAISALEPFELSIHVHGGFHRPPKPLDAAQTQLMQAVTSAGALLDLPIAWKSSGGVCEGNNLHAAGLPNIDTLGVRGGDIHSTDEYAWPDSFAERACLSAAILCKIASGDIDAPAIRACREAGL